MQSEHAEFQDEKHQPYLGIFLEDVGDGEPYLTDVTVAMYQTLTNKGGGSHSLPQL